jgi:ABC-type multidrug transport system ATPase subunit
MTFAILWIAGVIFRFRYWTLNSPAAIFITFFLWGHTLVCFSFLFYSFFSRSRSATTVGYIWVFATGILAAQIITQYFRNTNTPGIIVFFLSVVPQFAMYRGLFIFSNGVAFTRPGLSFQDALDKGLGQVWGFFVVEALICLILGIYLEAVLPTGYGVKKHPLFFFQKSFWCGSKQNFKTSVQSEVAGEPEDVARARKRLAEHSNEYLLRIEDLHKVHPGSNGVPDKVAVKSLALGVHYGECFGFLGPNGAGKSTTISILSGLYPATGGTAVVNGYDLRTDIEQIHQMMGVCPQDNVLWEDLTAEEHLLFFGRIKNMRGKELDNAVQANLEAVNLWGESKRAGQFSGGMKRRLAVACAFMGNPKLVLLDEPSTGLDPASRRQLWDLIVAKKKECAMLLTTHHMEEADALSDRIAIFVSGQLKCLGSSAELKSRYGKGFKVNMSFNPNRKEEAEHLLLTLAPEATMLNSISGTANYEVPKEQVKLSQFFSEFEKHKEECGITDWGISNTTLEEVFLKITEAEERSKKNKDMKKQPANYQKNEFELKQISV